MALAEDASSVLEQWVQDVANLPAEIMHLLEEIQAKDQIAAECRQTIHSRDSGIQKFCKANGAAQVNPKEDQHVQQVMGAFDKAQALQDEKIALGEKARVLLDRQIKRLDLQIRSLEQAGILAPDPLMPSLLHNSPGNRLPPLSNSTTPGTSTPLNPAHGSTAGNPLAATAGNIPNAALARLVSHAQPQGSQRVQSPGASAASTPGATVSAAAAAVAAAAGGASALARHARESSLDAKRRRLNAPATSSNLRQSSLGPQGSTPKASTPTGGARAGSAGPRAGGMKKPSKTAAGSARGANLNKKGAAARRKGGRKGLSGLKSSMSDTGEDSALSEVEGSESERHSVQGGGGAGGQGEGEGGADGTEDVEMAGMDDEDEDGADNKKYCTCHSVSYGNMVACDNDECEYEWFHWSCVGMTKEPVGKWYCEECRQKLGMK